MAHKESNCHKRCSMKVGLAGVDAKMLHLAKLKYGPFQKRSGGKNKTMLRLSMECVEDALRDEDAWHGMDGDGDSIVTCILYIGTAVYIHI